MFDPNRFKAKCTECGIKLENMAAIMGVNQATLYRKINGISDFTRNEIQLYKAATHASSEEIELIFFAEKLA